MRLKRKGNSGTWSRGTRALWLRLVWHQVSVHVPKTDDDIEHIVIVFTKGTDSSVSIDLSRLTQHELAAFRQAVLLATDLAEPIVEALDLKAQLNHDDGDDSDDRVYRGLPTLVVRRSAFDVGSHSQGILDRYKDALQGAGGSLLPGRGSAGDGPAVDEPLEDAEPEADDDPSAES